MIEIAHQRRAGLAAGDMTRRTAHVDIDDVGAGRFRDPCALRHPMRLATRELDDMRADAGCLAAQKRHRPAVHEFVAGGHLGDDQSGAEGGGKPSKGGIGDAGHRRQENPVGDSNLAYFQRLRA